jgi:glycosyltransferase involved in cell wall biosynthesis
MRIVVDLQGAQSASRFRGIGRYSLALAHGIVRNAGAHEIWLVLNGGLPDAIAALRAAFDGLVPQERIRVFDLPGQMAEHYAEQPSPTRAGEMIREQFIAQLRPDAVLVTSLFEGYIDDTVASVGAFADGADTAVVLYDLIPFLNPQAYLPTARQQAYYDRKIASLRRAGLLLAISDYSRQEAIDALGLEPDRVIAISTAVDDRFQPGAVAAPALDALRQRFGIRDRFIMYAPGGFDARKNLGGLITAHAALPAAIRDEHQLLIASKLDARDRERFEQHAAQLGLRAGEVLFTDYVDDDTLVDLYRAATLFVFPSLHEGFGLPALEAMASGAIVIGADNTSIPEVIGCAEALFDAREPATIAAKIVQVLEDPAMQSRLREHGARQARRFSWDITAQRALRALEAHAARPRAAPPRAKRRLAFVSPLPPERTGIADYAAQCLPALAEHFDIELIVRQEQVTLPPSLAALPRRDVAWFTAHADSYDQIIYQFGNSPYHSHMFDLLRRFPGVVVLHDFFLGNVLAYEQITGGMPDGWSAALFHSHGYEAVRLALGGDDGQEQAKLRYPCNLEVLQGAQAVIVHSEHARSLARQWYGPDAGCDWRLVPLPRSAPQGTDKARARAALGIADDAFVVCSFGFVDPTKLSHRLLDAWLASPMRADRRCELVLVGANHGGAYGQQLLATIGDAGVGARARITGWTDDDTYHLYLAAADVGVQLRSMSRGETSAAVLDCMNYGLATVVNANGSMAALPAHAVRRLDEEFDTADLTAALTQLYVERDARLALGASAAAVMRESHRPAHAARLYADALDQTWRDRTQGLPALADALVAIPGLDTGPDALRCMAAAVAASSPPRPTPRQLLIDVTNIVRHDLGTGIERVVRMQLLELLRQPPPASRVEPVYLSNDNGHWRYRYARGYAGSLLGMPAPAADALVDVGPGDVFYAPDYAPHIAMEAATSGLYERWRQRGVSVNFLVHDLLPVLRPEFFPYGADGTHGAWLDCVAANADRLLCISSAVADELRTWLATRERPAPRAIAVLHHGADFHAAAGNPAPEYAATLDAVAAAPSFLMVGTVEPRKGHLQALAACEALWREGLQVNLVIVGSEGWRGLADGERRTIPEIVARLRHHPELGKRLHWLQGIDDATLRAVYQSSAALLMASEGEGFGLPLIEAAQHRLPLIARDIPVFREVAAEHAWYFRGLHADDLAQSLRAWLDAREAGALPDAGGLRWRTWADNAAELGAVLLDEVRA